MTTLQRIIKYCAMAFAAFLIISIIGGICSGLGMVFYFFHPTEEAVGEMQNYPITSDIESLKIDVSAAALEIVAGDQFSVQSNHNYLNVDEEQGVLKITEEKFLFNSSSNEIKVILTIPEEFVFEDASITAGAGKVSVDSLSANTLYLELGAGATKIDCLKVQTRAKVDSGTGKLTILDGEIHDLSMDIGVGKLEMTSKLTGRCSVDYGVGSAEITLMGSKEDYQIELDKGLGSATLDGKSMEDDSVYGAGETRIDIDGGIGSLQIEFEEALGL
ncbi:MAG: DUF4097 family beta strand repeat-containing protein [Clostridiales bacterium]|nr:DUF4097 family beta strand repeat-containing protein [Clostridiales bacterium]